MTNKRRIIAVLLCKIIVNVLVKTGKMQKTCKMAKKEIVDKRLLTLHLLLLVGDVLKGAPKVNGNVYNADQKVRSYKSCSFTIQH